MMTAIRVRMPAPLQFVRMTTSILGTFAGLISPPHHRVRPRGRDRQTRSSPCCGRRTMRCAGVLVLGCLLAGCTAVDRVEEPLTSSPSILTPAGSATTAVEDPAIAIETPFVNGEVGTPVSVMGTAEVVDAALTVRVLGED